MQARRPASSSIEIDQGYTLTPIYNIDGGGKMLHFLRVSRFFMEIIVILYREYLEVSQIHVVLSKPTCRDLRLKKAAGTV
jgi:hypothetical protein